MRFRKVLLVFLLASIVHPCIGAKAPIDLFNGQDLTGWVAVPEAASNEPNPTWTVKEGVLQCTGHPVGYLRTEKEYEDYLLSLEWRWTGAPGNNGVMVHIIGEDQVWPKSFEAQLQHRDAGDIWVIGGADFKEHTNKEDRRVVKRQPSNEKPIGEWNVMEVECRGDTIAVRVNGLEQNVATEISHSKGKIGLQSEAAPIEFRNIRISSLED